MAILIDAHDISYRYGNYSVFAHVDLQVNKGDFVAIIGPNGAGKSTLLKLLLNEIKSDTGYIKLFNQSIDTFHDYAKLGYVPQNSQIKYSGFPATVQEVVQTSLYSKIGLFKFANNKQKQEVQTALQHVNMDQYSNRLIGSLSGGQQQRVMLARVLVNEPEIMILDEPTVGIDANTVSALYQLLSHLNKEKKLTIILITHDLHSVIDIATKFYCLEKKSLLQLTKKQVLEEQMHLHVHPEPNCEKGCCNDDF